MHAKTTEPIKTKVVITLCLKTKKKKNKIYAPDKRMYSLELKANLEVFESL